MYAIIIDVIVITSNIIDAYDLYIIAYIHQHDADNIPINLIKLVSSFKNDINDIIEAIIGKIEYMLSYVSNDILINIGIIINTNNFFLFLKYRSKIYISINAASPIILHTVPVIPPNI